MRVVFAGTPEFAAVSLRALLDGAADLALDVVAVLTQPDRPAGRGLHHAHGPVKALALAHGLTVLQPPRLAGAELLTELAALEADVWVVAAYGLILPPTVLALPRRGCINVHASLLPRWRGAAPIQRALLAGDRETGISIMQMDEGLDTGPVLLRAVSPIASTDTAGTLHDRLAGLGARALCEVLAGLPEGRHPPVPQPEAGATYAAKLTKADSRIDWALDAARVARRIRALDPAPGAQTLWRGTVLKLFDAREAGPSGAVPGAVVGTREGRLVITCGTGTVLVGEIQRAGGRRLPVVEFLRGNDLAPGTVMGA